MSPPDFTLSHGAGEDNAVNPGLPPEDSFMDTVPGETSALDTEELSGSAGRQPEPPTLSPPKNQEVRASGEEDKKTTYVSIFVAIDRDMNNDEFRRYALEKVFGGAPPKVIWVSKGEAKYTAALSPHEVKVSLRLIRETRGKHNREAGIKSNVKGEIEGSRERRDRFKKSGNSKEKQALNREIDRRYYENLRIRPGTMIKPHENGKIGYHNQIRDEVLYQKEFLDKLPPEVKKLMKFSTDARKYSARELDQLFRIAQRLSQMDLAAILDYFSKATGSTRDLDKFELALEEYQKERAGREVDNADRESIQKTLYGQEDLYRQYKDWKESQEDYTRSQARKNPNPKNSFRDTADEKKEALLQALNGAGYVDIPDFERFIKGFVDQFQKEAYSITMDLLRKYEGRLYREGVRYQDPAQVNALHGKLGGFRDNYQQYKKNDAVRGARTLYDQTPGPPGRNGPAPYSKKEADEAGRNADQAKQNAEGKIGKLGKQHPLLQEDQLPEGKRLNRNQMSQADPTTLGAMLQTQVKGRLNDARRAKAQLVGNPQLVFKLEQLMPRYYQEMGIPPGGICDQIVRDKVSQITWDEFSANVLLTVVGLALAAVTYGAASPLIAGGAMAGGAAVSSYFAYEEYNSYVTQSDLAAVGFTKENSPLWLIVAVVAAAVDLGAATKALRTLSQGARNIESMGEFSEFVNQVRSFGQAGEMEEKIAKAIEKAARARRASQEAMQDLRSMVRGQPTTKSLADPAVYEAMVRLATSNLRQGVNSFHYFVLELQKAGKIRMGANKLNKEEIAKAKEAWDQAYLLHKSAKDPVDIMNGKKVFGRYSDGSHLEIISKKKIHGGNTIKLQPDKTTTITGTLSDTNSVGRRGGNMPGATNMGENPGGINVLRSPKWPEIIEKYKYLEEAGKTDAYWRKVTNEFWETANKPWMDEAIKRGDSFRMVSDPADPKAIYTTKKGGGFVMRNGKRVKSIFGREIDYLKSKGYTIGADGIARPPE